MPPRRPTSLISVPIRSRFLPSTIPQSRLLQTRSQSTSETPSPPQHSGSSRSSYSRGANLASFAAEGDLLTTTHKNPPRLSPASQSSSSQAQSSVPPKPLAFPRPVLKTNPYAQNYTVSEADLDEPEEPFRASVTSQIEHQPSSTTEPAEPTSHPRKGGRTIRTIRRLKSKSEPPRVLTGPELVYKPIDLGNEESVQLHDGFIVFKSPRVKSGVISWGRLRDSCTCKICRDPSTSQKNFTTGQAMREAYPSSSDGRKGVRPLIEAADISNPKNKSVKKGLKITWKGDGQGHATYLTKFKLRLLTDRPFYQEVLVQPPIFDRTLWDTKEIANSPKLRIPLEEIESKDPAALLGMLEQLQKFGLVIVENVPTSPTEDEECHLRKVMGYIGEIRNTFYGETWNVKSMKKSKNVAYTNLDLGLHMDLLYFSSPPRFQALHCLRNRVNGGTSYFVDSFKVAHDLPDDTFRRLQQVQIPYVYDNDNHLLRYPHPVIAPSQGREGMKNDKQYSINWSPPFRDMKGPVSHLHEHDSLRSVLERATDEINMFKALETFEKSLSDPKYKFEFLLKEGDLVIFDNRRILHARTGFSDKTPEELKEQGMELVDGEPTRWLKGCYLDGEVVWDKLAVLKKQVDAGRKQERTEWWKQHGGSKAEDV
ncbi:hypothetical protein I302_103376 [Kwoniella bestiolae CBS 10118]|uniref:TauD/TfdA-like domain-containing protein n=1 Tax=Kwoniella bestiolae CBS 10118 TaxID=1296100 RepID=A0A1B9G876_9TREE|nr:hypothetical protein I302_02077 [Kwoniella bestiolae CBS 10118]OCF27237.1 hypothetical protein I302_02077 [Kwoniella bestiolae CBS 10118]